MVFFAFGRKYHFEACSRDAFLAIDEVVAILLSQTESIPKWRCGCFILGLARKSGTTEISPRLNQEWLAVFHSLVEFGDITLQIKQWFRK
jgi:hypothetical protein